MLIIHYFPADKLGTSWEQHVYNVCIVLHRHIVTGSCRRGGEAERDPDSPAGACVSPEIAEAWVFRRSPKSDARSGGQWLGCGGETSHFIRKQAIVKRTFTRMRRGDLCSACPRSGKSLAQIGGHPPHLALNLAPPAQGCGCPLARVARVRQRQKLVTESTSSISPEPLDENVEIPAVSRWVSARVRPTGTTVVTRFMGRFAGERLVSAPRRRMVVGPTSRTIR